MTAWPLWLRRLPVVLAMLLLLLPWGVRALNGAASALQGQPVIVEHVLAGYTDPAPLPDWTAAGLWSGAAQQAFAAHFDQSLPLLPTAVELKNQLYFSVLHQSGVPGIVLGRDNELYQSPYIQEYCTRNTSKILQGAERWAAALAQLQAWYAADGKVFVYLITPSKAATLPQYLPPGTPCWGDAAERDRLLPAWDAVLDRHGVRYVDAATLVRQARSTYPFEMFPRGGTHWHEGASVLAAQALSKQIDRAPTPWKLPEINFTWRLTRPEGVSRDITDMLNLPAPPLDYTVPAVSVHAPPVTTCTPVKLGIVGGSFDYEIIFVLMQLPCPPDVAFYGYFKDGLIRYPSGIRSKIDPAEREKTLLDDAQVVLLEENESIVVRSDHVPAFYAMVAARHGAPPLR